MSPSAMSGSSFTCCCRQVLRPDLEASASNFTGTQGLDYIAELHKGCVSAEGLDVQDLPSAKKSRSRWP